MVLRKFLFCLFCISCFLCYFAHAVSNDVLEVKKTVSEDRDGNYIVSVGYKSVGAGRVQKVQIIDSYPEGLQLLSGEIVVAAKDVRMKLFLTYIYAIFILLYYIFYLHTLNKILFFSR